MNSWIHLFVFHWNKRTKPHLRCTVCTLQWKVETWEHSRRMETEAKAKSSSLFGGAEFVQFLAALCLDLFGRNGWIQRVYLEKIDRGKTASAARNFATQTDATEFAFASVSILLPWLRVHTNDPLSWILIIIGSSRDILSENKVIRVSHFV